MDAKYVFYFLPSWLFLMRTFKEESEYHVLLKSPFCDHFSLDIASPLKLGSLHLSSVFNAPLVFSELEYNTNLGKLADTMKGKMENNVSI